MTELTQDTIVARRGHEENPGEEVTMSAHML